MEENKTSSAKEGAEDEGEVDASGLEDSDIDIVMKQGECSRAKAVKALKEHNGVSRLFTEVTLKNCPVTLFSLVRMS